MTKYCIECGKELDDTERATILQGRCRSCFANQLGFLAQEAENEGAEFRVKYLGGHIDFPWEGSGVLRIASSKVCFELKGSEDICLEIPINGIEDVKSFTEKESDMLGIRIIAGFSFVGKTQHKIIEITCRDDNGILQHPMFELDDPESLVNMLYNLRIKNTTWKAEKNR